MTIGEIAAKLVALDAWKTAIPCHWALKPRGSAFPYFFCVVPGEVPLVKVRVLLLDGWQTFHDFVRTQLDNDFGFYLTPMEMPHFELLVLKDGAAKLFRNDTGYIPRAANARESELCAKMLWEAYGVLMRLETDAQLPLKFADEKAIFARVEAADGTWRDEPIAIPPPRPHVEQVSFAKKAIAEAKDLPIRPEEVWELDLRIVPGLMTQEPHPHMVYALAAFHATSGEPLFRDQVTAGVDGGLRALWEGMPPRVLQHMIERHVVPSELRVGSGRVFRLMRPLCIEIPFKLSKVADLPHFKL